ncbi:MAG: type II toxin-antitoxin system VapC family toxin [Candidatus Aminicenantia bacterium]
MEDLIIADTDGIIDFFADIPPFAQVISKLINKDQLAITSISVYELYAGITGKKRLKQIETFIENIFIFPLNTVEAAIAGKIFTDLKAKGKLIGNQDILITGICIANSLPLLTKNQSHFRNIEKLKLISVDELI